MRAALSLRHKRNLGHGVALLLIGGLTAGCSSGVSRFTADNLFTSSNQQAVAQAPANDTYIAPTPASAEPVRTAKVGRSSLPPVGASRPDRTEIAEAPARKPRETQVAALEPAKRRAQPLSRAEEIDAAEVGKTDAKTTGKSARLAAAKPDASVDGSNKAARAKASAGSYTVASGDTLSRIARKHNVSVSALKAANGDSDALRIGQDIKIPGGGETVIAAKTTKVDPVQTASTRAKKTETLAKAQKPVTAEKQVATYTPPAKSKAIEAVETENDEAAPSSTGISRMRWPAKGRVAKSRDGIDIQVPEGTAVKAAENGVVIYAGDGLKDFGNTVLVRHENGLVTVYGHASQLNVKRGQKVKRGDQIATSGMSGKTDAPKLHFEVRKDSAPVDPSTYLE